MLQALVVNVQVRNLVGDDGTAGRLNRKRPLSDGHTVAY